MSGTGLDHAELDLAAEDAVSLVVRVKPASASEIEIGLLPTVTGLDDVAGLAGASAEAALPFALDALTVVPSETLAFEEPLGVPQTDERVVLDEVADPDRTGNEEAQPGKQAQGPTEPVELASPFAHVARL